MLRLLYSALFLAGLLCMSSDAIALKYKYGEAYAEPTYNELIQTLVMMGEKTIKIPAVADEYSKLLYCDLYLEKYKDDFAWYNSREKIIDRVVSKKEPYRVLYEIVAAVNLEKYSFETQDYPFDADSRIVNVSSLSFSSQRTQGQDPCREHANTNVFPPTLSVLLNQPFTLDRFKIPVNEAEKLLGKIKKESGDKRKLYARFRVRLQSIVEAPPEVAGKKKKKRKSIVAAYNDGGVFRGEVTSIDLFLDREMTKHIANIPMD